jgi:hypothetical protein
VSNIIITTTTTTTTTAAEKEEINDTNNNETNNNDTNKRKRSPEFNETTASSSDNTAKKKKEIHTDYFVDLTKSSRGSNGTSIMQTLSNPNRRQTLRPVLEAHAMLKEIKDSFGEGESEDYNMMLQMLGYVDADIESNQSQFVAVRARVS